MSTKKHVQSKLNLVKSMDSNDHILDKDFSEIWEDLPEYLIYAAQQYQIEIRICFYHLDEAMRATRTSHYLPLEEQTSYMSLLDTPITVGLVLEEEKPIKIIFEEPVPRCFFKILALVIRHHTSLQSIEFRGKGHSPYAIFEMKQMLSHSNITDISFDGARIRSYDYYTLLDETTNLKYLSLARCSITDDIVKEIAKRLSYGQPAAKRIRTINLTSNFIYDDGAKSLAKMLETNRSLCCLNLCGNYLTDEGAIRILDILGGFKITNDEFNYARRLHLAYLNDKEKAAREYMDKLKTKRPGADDVKPKSKGKKPPFPRITKPVPGGSGVSLTLAKAEALLQYPVFDYPLFVEATPMPGGGAMIRGNGTLCRLNLSYNNLTELTLAHAMPILRLASEGRRCLFLLCFEGTMLPVLNPLVSEADKLMDMQLQVYGRKIKDKQASKRRRSSVR